MAVTLLALLLVAAVPVALLAGVVLMIVGHVVGGLAVFGGSVLAAAVAVALAGVSGIRHLRKLVSGLSFPVVRPDGSQYADAAESVDGDYANVVQLDRSEYTEVRLSPCIPVPQPPHTPRMLSGSRPLRTVNQNVLRVRGPFVQLDFERVGVPFD